MSNTAGIMVIIAVYLIGMVAVGIYFSRKNSNSKDYYLGGRKLGPIVTAMSAEASDMSSWLLMGLPGVAYLTGIADAGWTAIGLAIGTYLNWLIVAKRLRRYSAKNNSITVPGFFSNRYRDDKNIIVTIASIFIVIFFVPYTASGFAACGKLFSTLFDVPYVPAMVVSAIVIVLYTALGGFSAASTTDLVQSIVMTVSLISIVVFGVSLAGGFDAVMDNAKDIPGMLTMFATHNPETGGATSHSFLTIVSTLAWGLGYFGMPHVLLRFMAIEDENKIKISRRIASIWVVISMAISIFIGLVGIAASNYGKVEMLSGSASETIIIKFANLLSNTGFLGIVFAGLTVSGILACTMSTADSQLLAAASSISEDITKITLKKNLSEKKSLLIARITVLVIALISMFIASDPNSSVFNIVSFAWAGFGAVFGPVMLAALFWKRSNKYGVIAGMLSGGITIFVWKYIVRPLGGVWDIYELLPAFIISLIFIIVVSLATEKPDSEIVEEFEEVVAGR